MENTKSLNETRSLLTSPGELKTHISNALYAHDQNDPAIQDQVSHSNSASAVLFLLGMHQFGANEKPELCLILNKRSSKVKQAGDLCCPGGGISFSKDKAFARLLSLPGSPLSRWSFWKGWKKEHPDERPSLTLLLAASLRECYEEMRLNPLRVAFMGVLPVQQLGTFGREIYPMVGWMSRQKKFVLNWEVEKIITVPIRHLLNPDNYARTRFTMDRIPEDTNHLNYNDRPCFLHTHDDETEILWGATFRITTVFLQIIFGFTLPPVESLPVVQSTLNKNYMTGSDPKEE